MKTLLGFLMLVSLLACRLEVEVGRPDARGYESLEDRHQLETILNDDEMYEDDELNEGKRK